MLRFYMLFINKFYIKKIHVMFVKQNYVRKSLHKLLTVQNVRKFIIETTNEKVNKYI